MYIYRNIMCLCIFIYYYIISSIAEPPLTEGDNLAAAIAGIVGVVTTLTVVMGISGMLGIHWRKMKGIYDIRTAPVVRYICVPTYYVI